MFQILSYTLALRRQPARVFVRGVGYQVVVHSREPQWARGKVRTLVALMGKRHECTDDVQYILSDTASRERVILRNKFPKFGDVLRCQRVKVKAMCRAH